MVMSNKLITQLFSFGILAGFIIAEAWILRLPCKTEGEFSVQVKGYALENSIIGRYTSSYLTDCIGKCFNENQCRSINFKETGTDNCELNEQIKENSTSANFKPKANWVYLSTDYTLKKAGSMCEALNPCDSESMCVDTCDCPWYTCVKCGTYRTKANSHFCYFIEATENLALGKTAVQSTEWDKNTLAKNAVDGKFEPFHATTAITKYEINPWWRVDLEKTAIVQSVAIQNRWDLLWAFRLNPFDVRVGDSLANNGRDNQLCVQSGSILSQAQLKRFKCAFQIPGRYVSVHLNREMLLELSEVQVFGFFYTVPHIP